MIDQDAPTFGETYAELGERFHRSAESLRKWLAEPGAPAPIGYRRTTRKPAAEYDPVTVTAYLRASGRLPQHRPVDPAHDPLLTLVEAAAYAGIAEKTALAYVARGQWPAPDIPTGKDGPRRWRQSTIDKALSKRRRMS